MRRLFASAPLAAIGLLALLTPALSGCSSAPPDAGPTASSAEAIVVAPWHVTVGLYAACALDPGNRLWCWGDNQRGELGNGSQTNTATPTLVAGGAEGPTWQSMSTGTGWGSTCGVRSDGTLWCWGDNSAGQLGLGTSGSTAVLVPTQVGAIASWRQVSVGGNAACALRSDGSLWCWGTNGSGQLGLGTMGANVTAPTQVSAGTSWRQVAMGDASACAITTGGALYCWGVNTAGALGVGSAATYVTSPQQVGTSTAWTQLAEGEEATCAIQGGNGPFIGGSLWCWGWDMLGDGTTSSPTQVGSTADWTAVSVGNAFACGIQRATGGATGTLWCWGTNGDGQLGRSTAGSSSPWQPVGQVPQGTDWVTIAAGFQSACATGTDGSMWCWGTNQDGLSGDGSLTPYENPSPVRAWSWNQEAAFGSSTCATRTDGTLWCWGDNSYGQVGQHTTSPGPFETPVQVGTQTWGALSASANGYHACAIRGDTTLWCWGYNAYGQLGNGTTTTESAPVQVNSATGWQQIAAGYSHTCGIWDYSLWCWGDNSYGQLGTGNYVSSSYTTEIAPSQEWIAVSAGAYSTCAVRSDYTLWCWGYNGTGVVGQGSTAMVTYPSPTQVGTAANWWSLGVGTFYACGTRWDGSLYCWGANGSGQLGVGDYTTRTAPVQVGAGTAWMTPAAGQLTTCAAAQNGALWCWGSDVGGMDAQGNGATASTYASPTRVGTQTSWVSTSVSANHACASDGQAYCWGSGTSGQLGDGSTTSATTPQLVQ